LAVGSPNRNRLPIWLLLVLACAGLWLIVVPGYGDYLARFDPARSLAWSSGQPDAHLLLAERKLVDGDWEAAQAHAQASLAAAPLQGRALRVLGATRELEGNRDSARRLIEMAATVAPRDIPAQYWLAMNDLRDRDLDAALARFDRLLRMEPEASRQVFPVLLTVASNPIGMRGFAPLLASNPPWRQDFMRQFLASVADVRQLDKLLGIAAVAGVRLEPAEQAALLNQAFVRRDWPRVRRLLAIEGIQPAVVRDGGFDRGAADGIRGWAVAKHRMMDVILADSRLRLHFLGQRAEFGGLSQWLLLSPGSYLLSGRVRLLDLDTAQGLRWWLQCDQSSDRLVETELFKGRGDWTPFRVEFSVPEECPAQSLRLELAARIAAETHASGSAEFDDLEITPAPDPAPLKP
jgi:hypothetical protein